MTARIDFASPNSRYQDVAHALCEYLAIEQQPADSARDVWWIWLRGRSPDLVRALHQAMRCLELCGTDLNLTYCVWPTRLEIWRGPAELDTAAAMARLGALPSGEALLRLLKHVEDLGRLDLRIFSLAVQETPFDLSVYVVVSNLQIKTYGLRRWITDAQRSTPISETDYSLAHLKGPGLPHNQRRGSLILSRICRCIASDWALNAVISVASLIAASMTGVAVTHMRRESSIHHPNWDSGFYIALSQVAIGLAAVYCSLLPSLRGGRLPITNKWLFGGTLGLSLVTSVVAVIVYPLHQRVYELAMYVSNILQLVTNVQLYRGSTKTAIDALEEVSDVQMGR